jgi:hypothetical protein
VPSTSADDQDDPAGWVKPRSLSGWSASEPERPGFAPLPERAPSLVAVRTWAVVCAVALAVGEGCRIANTAYSYAILRSGRPLTRAENLTLLTLDFWVLIAFAASALTFIGWLFRLGAVELTGGSIGPFTWRRMKVAVEQLYSMTLPPEQRWSGLPRFIRAWSVTFPAGCAAALLAAVLGKVSSGVGLLFDGIAAALLGVATVLAMLFIWRITRAQDAPAGG